MTVNEVRQSVAVLEAEVDLYFTNANPSVLPLRESVYLFVRGARELLDMRWNQPNYGLSMAAEFLSMGTAALARIRSLLDRYGGPSRARLISPP